MKIVIDTNVVISGTFFGGFPRKIIEAVVGNKISACANESIIDEYVEIIEEMIDRKNGKLDKNILLPFINKLNVVKPTAKVKVSRDKDDNKFIECAIDTKAMYIVSGDNNLLDIIEYKGVQIITAKDFCKKYEENIRKIKKEK